LPSTAAAEWEVVEAFMAEAAVEVASMEAEAVGFMVEAQAVAASTEVELEAASEGGLPRHGQLVPELQASRLHTR
jgi:hypothetical protein